MAAQAIYPQSTNPLLKCPHLKDSSLGIRARPINNAPLIADNAYTPDATIRMCTEYIIRPRAATHGRGHQESL